MEQKTKKEQLILDIQNLLNTYENLNSTCINPNILTFMNEETLINIISSLLDEKEELNQVDEIWLEQFKSEK